jgi:MarR family transcriptional regulator, negative regulator of the multidrug operon emrRAB
MEPELRRAVRALAVAGRGLEKAAAPLTLPQYRILALTAVAPERASRLAERAGVAKATLTGVIDALEAHGWIERTVVAGDRRGVSLAVTPAGAAVLDQTEQAMAAWLASVAGDQAAQVCEAMAALSDGIRERAGR